MLIWYDTGSMQKSKNQIYHWHNAELYGWLYAVQSTCMMSQTNGQTIFAKDWMVRGHHVCSFEHLFIYGFTRQGKQFNKLIPCQLLIRTSDDQVQLLSLHISSA